MNDTKTEMQCTLCGKTFVGEDTKGDGWGFCGCDQKPRVRPMDTVDMRPVELKRSRMHNRHNRFVN